MPWVCSGVRNQFQQERDLCGSAAAHCDPDSCPAAFRAGCGHSGDSKCIVGRTLSGYCLAQRDGIVQELFYDQDSWVKKGTVLAGLDNRELLTSLEKARLDQRVAENNFSYQEASKKAKDAAYQRRQEFRKFGLSSQAALEQAEFESTGAGFDLDSWKAAIEQKKAAVHELEIELEKTRIVAPFDGYVVRRAVRTEQNTVKNGVFFRLSKLCRVPVRFLLPQSAGPRPTPGYPLKVVLADRAESREYDAHVKLVSPYRGCCQRQLRPHGRIDGTPSGKPAGREWRCG